MAGFQKRVRWGSSENIETRGSHACICSKDLKVVFWGGRHAVPFGFWLHLGWALGAKITAVRGRVPHHTGPVKSAEILGRMPDK